MMAANLFVCLLLCALKCEKNKNATKTHTFTNNRLTLSHTKTMENSLSQVSNMMHTILYAHLTHIHN